MKIDFLKRMIYLAVLGILLAFGQALPDIEETIRRQGITIEEEYDDHSADDHEEF